VYDDGCHLGCCYCTLVEVYWRFRNSCCLHNHGYRRWVTIVLMGAASTSETSANIYQTTWRNIHEDSHLHIAAVRTWNLTSPKYFIIENNFILQNCLWGLFTVKSHYTEGTLLSLIKQLIKPACDTQYRTRVTFLRRSHGFFCGIISNVFFQMPLETGVGIWWRGTLKVHHVPSEIRYGMPRPGNSAATCPAAAFFVWMNMKGKFTQLERFSLFFMPHWPWLRC
jgi:hypothetical protein